MCSRGPFWHGVGIIITSISNILGLTHTGVIMREFIYQLRTNRATALVLVAIVALVFTLASLLAPQRTSVVATAVGTPQSLGDVVVEAERPRVAADELLWLARCIYSETKQPEEQELVAWVVRNRVETNYRGRTTYRSTVLDPWQFSAFNRNSPKRAHYSSLTDASTAQGFSAALEIAERVANAPAHERPFSPQTRHFYSERSMVGGRTPAWAVNKQPVAISGNIDPRRFRFFDEVS